MYRKYFCHSQITTFFNHLKLTYGVFYWTDSMSVMTDYSKTFYILFEIRINIKVGYLIIQGHPFPTAHFCMPNIDKY